MKRFLASMLGGLLAVAAHAQAPAPKIAISSLVADTMTVTQFEQRTGSNVPKPKVTSINMPSPALDIALLQAAQKEIAKAVPRASVFPLKVPAPGSAGDPALAVAGGKVITDNGLIAALKQQGFTHLLTATKYHGPNVVTLRNGGIAAEQGMLEGLGFYVDPVIRIQEVETGERATGIVSPYVYVQLRLIDLGSMTVAGEQTITATRTVSAARNKTGVDAWGALTPEEKVEALEWLIQRYVAEAVPLLFQPKERAPG